MISIKSDSVSISEISESCNSNNSSSHCKESDCYDRKVVDNLYKELKWEMDTICTQYGLKYELLWLILELEFYLEIYYVVKVNRLLCNYYYHRD